MRCCLQVYDNIIYTKIHILKTTYIWREIFHSFWPTFFLSTFVAGSGRFPFPIAIWPNIFDATPALGSADPRTRRSALIVRRPDVAGPPAAPADDLPFRGALIIRD
jgi:hypothetical protein